MSIAKVFKILITIVAMVVIGGVVLNVLLPNLTNQLVGAVENQIFRATGLIFDFNGDNVKGNPSKDTSDAVGANKSVSDEGGAGDGANVEGVN